MRKPLALVAFGITLLGCAGLPGAGSPPHADGIESYGTVSIGMDAAPFRKLTAGQEAGRRFEQVFWRGGAIAEVRSMGPAGQLLSTTTLTRDPIAGVVQQIIDPWGVVVATDRITPTVIPVEGGPRTATWTRELRSGVRTIRGCSGLKVTLDEQGLILEERCEDPAGRAIIDENGCHMMRRSRTEGVVTEESCFDEDGRPVDDNRGIHTTRSKVSAEGWVIEEGYSNSAGAPVSTADEGCARIRYDLDAGGTTVGATCLNSGGLPTQVAGGQITGWKGRADANGCLVETTWADIAGLPAEHRNIVTTSDIVDARCAILDHQTVDRDGALKMSSLWTPARTTYERNGEGLVTRQQCWGDKGVPVSCVFAQTGKKVGTVLEFSYDERGRQTEKRAFTATGEPTRACTAYPHLEKTSYGDDGRLFRRSYGNADGSPGLGIGVATIEDRYDPLGAEVSKRFLGLDGALVASSVGCAEIRTSYDDQHRLAGVACVGHDGEPAASTMLYLEVAWKKAARVQVERDATHHVVANVFYDRAGAQLRRDDCTDSSTPCYR